jgi:hypothetical protein
MKREDLSWLLGMANDMRAANDDEQLTDLPISVPEDVGACIIANAFNYGCEVNPSSDGPETSYIQFWSRHDAEVYCKVTNIDPVEIKSVQDSLSSGTSWRVHLTPELNDVAIAFDEGEYDEYDYWKWVENDKEEIAA